MQSGYRVQPCKSHPGAPLPPATKEFNLGEQGQDHQAKIPQFFNLIGSNVEKTAHMSGNPNAQSVPVMKNLLKKYRRVFLNYYSGLKMSKRLKKSWLKKIGGGSK